MCQVSGAYAMNKPKIAQSIVRLSTSNKAARQCALIFLLLEVEL